MTTEEKAWRLMQRINELRAEIHRMSSVPTPVFLAPGAMKNWATDVDVCVIHYYRLCLLLSRLGGQGASLIDSL